MTGIELVGWVGGMLFALCGVPQAWACYKQKHADGLNWPFLAMWLVGEVLTMYFVWETSRQGPLLLNYTVNLLCLLVILYYKARPAQKVPLVSKSSLKI